MPFVGKVRLRVHDDSSSNIRRRNEALRFSKRKLHSYSEDDGQEVGDGVGVCGGKHEERGKSPDLEVGGMGQVRLDVELCGEGVGAVLLDTGHDECGFSGREEVPGAGGELREVNYEEVADEGGNAGEEAFDL